MKQLLALIVLVLVLGLAAFVYRYEIERPTSITALIPNATSSNPTQACTDEAKICPDGSAVGRTGSNCVFAVCALPNIELSVGSSTVGFVLPGGYVSNPAAIGNDTTLLGVYNKPATETKANHTIVVRSFPILAGKTAEQVMIDNTMFESSGITATSTNQFKKTTIHGKTFYFVVLERFEGQIHSTYYLLGTNQVLRFEVLERDVTTWTDPKLVVTSLPQHQALERLLSTLQVSGI